MKTSTHIVIVESSDLIYEGLSTILHQSGTKQFVSRLICFDEIDSMPSNKEIDILYINPLLLFNKEREVRKIKKNYPQLLIVGVNTYIIDNKTLALYDLTFNIYDSSQQILSAINKQLEQKQTVSNEQDDNENLSERETQVLLQIIKGFTNKEIAEILTISVHTVISHRKNIMLKTGIRSQAGLALYAISKSLVSLDDFDL